MIELKPTDKPVIYRNFIEGLSARGIAVGYPEQAHIAWDAEQMNLRLIWHGAFMDASKHWTGRGQGFQTPMGDHVMELTPGQPLAELSNANEAWPATSARDAGFRFHGYDLDDKGRPSFRYSWNNIAAVDKIEPIAAEGDGDASLRRTLQLSADSAVANMYFRIAAVKNIETTDTGWLIDKAISVTAPRAQVRNVNGSQQLLVPVTFDSAGKATVTYQMVW